MASLAAMTAADTRPSAQLDVADAVPDRGSAALQISASLLWVPQAALIALAIGDATSAASTDRLGWFVFGVLSIGVLRSILDGIGARLAFRGARRAATKLRLQAVDVVAARSPLDAERAESGRVAGIIAEQAEMILPYIARFEIARRKAIVVPLAILLFVLSQSWAAAFVLFVAAPLIPAFMILIGWRAKEASEAQLVEAGDMNAFLLDRLRGISTIRALGAIDQTATRLRANAEGLRVRTMAVLRIAFLSSAVLELFSALGVAMVAVYVGFHLLGQLNFGTWTGALSLGEGLFILLLAPAFFEPLRDLSSVWHDRAAGKAAMDGLKQLADGDAGVSLVGVARGGTGSAADFIPIPSVVVHKLGFGYGESHPVVLNQFDLTVSAGEHIALLGPSGSGKSTLLALVAGLAPATCGSVSIGGHVLGTHNADELRRSIAWIGQRPHIFAGTLASNVALGRRVGRERISEALRFAKLDYLAQTRGPDSIGENGIGLSGGEMMRLAIARAAAQSHISLILADEPTAHLDAETARDIIDNLLALARGKTLIVATHDLTLARRMDRVVRFGGGRLEEAA